MLLSPQRGVNERVPEIEWERPDCEKCGWAGNPVPILRRPEDYAPREEGRAPPEDGFILSEVPLRELLTPGR
jgi:hypothetical protein